MNDRYDKYKNKLSIRFQARKLKRIFLSNLPSHLPMNTFFKYLGKYISDEQARNYIRSLPVIKKKNFKEVFRGANADAIDLLEKMLELDADKRPTAADALAHAYLAQYADPNDEPTAEPYDQSFEDRDLSVAEWKQLVYEEVMTFRPREDS